MSEGLNTLAEGIGKVIKTVPDVYDDALKPTIQESGKILALIPRAINAALVPLRRWIANQEYNLAETEKLLAKKLEHIGEDKIITPEPYVAIPAIQAISYSMNSNELRNLYANLIAKSMNIDTKDMVHPSFVEIIKQLSPYDSEIFNLILQKGGTVPFLEIRFKNKTSSAFRIGARYLTSFENADHSKHKQMCCSIDNLIRCGLIFVEKHSMLDSSAYEELMSSEAFGEVKKEFVASGLADDFNLNCNGYVLQATDFGENFYSVCLKEL